ncbi:uncharacterized protein DEA37_0005736 [Paragonimus westermani]|uniref:Protein quiver n=1 Tax=Paragonimus westermani TaxID=34504 RepID=A0A5J4NVZ6_9TREM|nr:uncharacterized protein DEA37_0005736 [Paragonimus westermani]
MKQPSVFPLIWLIGLIRIKQVLSISCYSCVSINGSYRECEDPMSASVPVYRSCKQNVKDHDGLFYAHFCTKIKGTNQKDGSTLVLRLCSMERLADVATHCGQFNLDEQLYTGCIATCTRDWCNTGRKLSGPMFILCLSILCIVYRMFFLPVSTAIGF